MWFHALHNVVTTSLWILEETGGKEIAAVTRVFVLSPFFAIRALDGIMGKGREEKEVCGMKSGEWSEGPIIYPAYLNSARWKVGVSLSIPRGIISASSTMTSVTSFTHTPRGLPRGQWAPCRTDDTRDETSSLLCGHEAHFTGLAEGGRMEFWFRWCFASSVTTFMRLRGDFWYLTVCDSTSSRIQRCISLLFFVQILLI